MKNKLSVVLLLSLTLSAQNLKTTVNEVLSTNPILLERLKNYNAVKEDITIAKSDYYPKLDLSLGIGYEKTNKDTPDLGKQSFNYSVYQNSLKYTQNIFKGFETTYRVKQQKSRTTAAAYNYIEKVNDTSFRMVDIYLQVMKNKELLETEKANIKINTEIFIKVQKLYDAGLTTLSEVNKIESSLSLAKSNLVVQENTLLDVQYNLHRVLGRELKASDMIKPSLNITFPSSMDEATQFAMKNNPSLLVSNYNVKLAQDTYKESQSSFYPSFDIEISQAVNKNLSGIQGTDNRFRAMTYLKYNFFNGFADKATMQKNVSSIYQEVELKNELRREVIEGLRLSWAANEKLSEQLLHLIEYKKFSLKTLTLYTKEYDLGRRSLLDLLSAQNDYIGSKSQIINTKYSILFAKYRILDAMGLLVSTIMGDVENIYSNVGLNGTAPKNNDTLPIKLDRDNDLIVDDEDICNSSLATSMKNLYGCAYKPKNIQRIERYTGFLFENKSITLTDEAQDRIDNLILQLKPYNMSKIKFDLLGHADNNKLSEKKLLKLSKLRARLIKKILIEAGDRRVNIKIHAKSNKAPRFLTGTPNATKLNNRVDIIVKK